MEDRKKDEPIFKEYNNAQINALSKWYITPVDDNDLPIARYAPFNSYQAQNNSTEDIRIALNGSSNKAIIVYAGCGVVMTGHLFEWLLITNLDASEAIAANELDIQIGKGIEMELG